MRIAIVGAGYVGLIVAVSFASSGHQVICLEKDENKCQRLASGQCTILEKKLPQMLDHAIKHKTLSFTTKATDAIPSAELIFITVGTPCGKDGKADLSDFMSAILEVAYVLRNNAIIVIKSSVPPGTTATVQEQLQKVICQKNRTANVRVICNPEFLREGTALEDFLRPDRIVIGTDDLVAGNTLLSLYRSLINASTIEIITSPLNAELIKYASNSYLAVRLSYINELAGLCERLGGSINEVAAAMGADHRIGNEYLSAGLGYGGACLPKDTRALAYIAREACAPLTVLERAIAANSDIIQRLADRVEKCVTVDGAIAVWGISFKAGTEDIRNSPMLALIQELYQRLKCRFQVFDPAYNSFPEKYPKSILPLLRQTPEDAIIGTDALIVGTAWPQFKNIDFNHLQPYMKEHNVFDFAGALHKGSVLNAGFHYFACGEATTLD